ncbi:MULTISPECIES: hypothetical protein [unclassified Photorhabdus]|uniref:hypothetical protein n=3 Tax=Photorhabdus TaxID=29487 RepID=UPI000DCC99C3|nr:MULTISPECIES: hypothetical protein [unclassified Photorhabdus]RAW94721.1 hypothetical protein CKY03_19150 [Photorhabdus sp. S9-53]RAW94876.1 hypothetical protein CKY05_18940 [Photorhabdus sp. S10-54]RAW98870.1 hypothetical protein CKY04_18845 [Photorhabdus sp. S8-52]
MFNNRAVVLSILLSAANITGSSGLMIWVDTVLKNGGMILNAYIPVFSYLLGLSLGCMTISFFIRKMNIALFEKHIFGFFLLIATINCILFAKEIILIPVWLDALHRILWGVISGFIVIMGRNILITTGNEKKTNSNFSILSLALLSLPFLIPVIFSLLGLNSRTSADFFSAFIYSIASIIYFTDFKSHNLKNNNLKSNNLKKQKHNIKYPVETTNKLVVFFAFSSLVIINVCFFLSLMIMPAMRTKYFEHIDIIQMYIILLIIWFPCAIGIMKIIKSALLTKIIMIGNIMQLFSLGFCLLSIITNSGILYLLFTIMVFLANSIMQPIFFSYLGLYSKNSLYTLGMQSGIYVFITMIILFYTIYLDVGVEEIIAGFTILLISSIIISPIFRFAVDSKKQ